MMTSQPTGEATTTSSKKTSRLSRIRNSVSCPPSGPFAYILTNALLILFLWCGLYAVTDSVKSGIMMPGGKGFALLALIVLCRLAGGAFVSIAHLPGLLGMLIMGLFVKNVPALNVVGNNLDRSLSADLRTGALLVIMARGGLGLDADALRRLSCVVLRLAFCTAFVEAVVIGITSMFLLGLPWGYAFMLGTIICPSSPAVVVPCMLHLQERGLGTAKGVPTLIMASASVDDVMAITAFGVLFGITFAEGGLFMKIISGPLQSVAGIISGIAVGRIFWYIPPKGSRPLVELRCVLLLLAGVLALFSAPTIGLDAFGALATIVCAFVARIGWKNDWNALGRDPVAIFFNDLWYVFEPILFGTIGAEIDFKLLKVERLAWGLLTLGIGCVFRALTTSVVVLGGGFNLKERVFIVIAWLPKATVQAAFASVIIDYAKQGGASEEVVGWGFDVMTLAVLSILITAPLGAAGLVLTAPRLLSRDVVGEVRRESAVGEIKNTQYSHEFDEILESRENRERGSPDAGGSSVQCQHSKV